MVEIQRMQDNLLLIRRAIGWTASEFGEQIGVTRQTINNIESGRNKLTKTQYIAMRSVIDAEIVKHPEETEMVKILLDMLIDHPENYLKADYNELLEKANLMSPSILAGTATRETVSKEDCRSSCNSWSSCNGSSFGRSTDCGCCSRRMVSKSSYGHR